MQGNKHLRTKPVYRNQSSFALHETTQHCLLSSQKFNLWRLKRHKNKTQVQPNTTTTKHTNIILCRKWLIQHSNKHILPTRPCHWSTRLLHPITTLCVGLAQSLLIVNWIESQRHAKLYDLLPHWMKRNWLQLDLKCLVERSGKCGGKDTKLIKWNLILWSLNNCFTTAVRRVVSED